MDIQNIQNNGKVFIYEIDEVLIHGAHGWALKISGKVKEAVTNDHI